ncbi:MAG TPA: hypothetical protein VK464_28140, partial [Symbiobacteriaceae bacterium]|nr:hypothetical protein [Symbiobacteriaceae bacterium]
MSDVTRLAVAPAPDLLARYQAHGEWLEWLAASSMKRRPGLPTSVGKKEACAMTRAILLAAACCLILGCSKAAPTPQPRQAPAPAATAAQETINPTVTPPDRTVTVAENLPKLEAP